jgi:succinyl-CoA synthetase beta subunit
LGACWLLFDDTLAVQNELSIFSFSEVDEYVIKAQIRAGGRGLGHFDNGFKSGVHITKEYVLSCILYSFT